ncbi:MAG TPA: hypothetical protein VE958_08090, partial [Bryobacteraceae bacterium]|nr:hypothetical protein [Bryobacteraceae bacterium]
MADDAMTAPAASTPATSAPSTPATPAVGTDFMSSIDSMLTSGETPDTTDQPDTGDEPIPEDPAQPQHAAATEHPPESWDSEIGEPQIVDGPSGEKLHQYTPEQSLALHSNSRFAQELRAAIPDITVQDAISHDQAYTDLSKIVHDMRRGAPDGVQRFANMILKESGGSRFAAGLTEQLVNHVRQNDPMAYDGLKGGFEKDIEKELYSLALKAKNDPRPAVRDGYRQLAEWFHYHIAN